MNTKRKIINSFLNKIYCLLFKIGCRTGCHQRADRSFFFKGYQFPICARCTGVIIGYGLTIPIYLLWQFYYHHCLIACLIMLLDWMIQYFKIRESTNIRRLVTGILGGFGVFGFQILLTIDLIRLIF